MTWEEKLLFLMFLDYKGVLKKWEKNHNKCKYGYYKIEDGNFSVESGFYWRETEEGDDYWSFIIQQWEKAKSGSITIPSLRYIIRHETLSDTIEVGCQTITKKDALKIADFIYECFGE